MNKDREDREYRSDRPTGDEPFSPATVDERIDQLLALPGQNEATSVQARFIHDLSALASEHTAMRDRVLERLLARAASLEQSPRPVTTDKKQKSSGERIHVMAQDGLYPKHTGRQRVAMVAAVIVTAAVVGSMLLLSLAGRHGTQTAGQVVATATPSPAGLQWLAYCNKQDLGWYAVCSTGQDKVLNITKTINGDTVILNAVYADNNRVILAYTHKYAAKNVHPQPGLVDMMLTTQQGTQLPQAGGSLMFDPRAKLEINVLSFDTSTVPSGTHNLSLHLQITLHAVAGAGQLKTVGTTSASFSVPFHPGRVANLNQTVTVNGIAITLQKVVVSPTQTRLYVHSKRLQVSGGPQSSPYSLSVGNFSIDRFNGAEAILPPGKGSPVLGVVLTENTSLINEQGQWTFKITSGAISGGSSNGTWIFHFTVPA